MLTKVHEMRKMHKNMGAAKLHFLLGPFLLEHQISMGRDKFYSLLRKHQMLVRIRRQYVRTTNSNHNYRKYPNIAKEIKIQQPKKLWVSDITYIRLVSGFAYLSLITDAYSKKVVGWCLWPTLSSKGPINALEMALNTENPGLGLIHHSDRGIQYCCTDYVNMLINAQIGISMTENGDPYENAIAERMNETFKVEYELSIVHDNINQAREAVNKSIDTYNNFRPHSSCDNLTPQQAHQGEGPLKQRWSKNRYKKRNLSG